MSASYPPGYPPQRRRPVPGGGVRGPLLNGASGAASRARYDSVPRPAAAPRPLPERRLTGAPVAPRTDPSLYEWDRLSTAQQQAVLRAIQGGRRSGAGRMLRRLALILVIVGLVAGLAVLALVVFHLGGFAGIRL